ncbi:MAG TPA: thiol reductant ABC exporter subunit CydD [Acidimicrobiales bacterium]|nr:thiol reductant ABC exporter subunit CydD [Acidimicrobiales bacterium]
MPGRVGARRGAERSRSGVDRHLVGELPVVRRTVVASVAVGLVATAAIVLQAVALARLLAGAMPGARPGDRMSYFVWLATAAAVRGLAALAGETLAHLGATRAKADLRARLVAAAISRAPTGAAGGPGDLATVTGRGLDALDVYIGRCLPDLVLAVVAPIALAVAVGVLDWISGLIVVLAIALFPVFGALVGRASLTLASNRWQQVEALGRHITDVFEGLPVLRAFDRTPEQRSKIERAGEALRAASLSTLRVAFLSALVLDTLASVSVALLAVPLGLRLLNGTVGLAAALAVLIVAPEVFLPLRRASAEFHESTEGLAAVARALALIGPEQPGDDEPVAPDGLAGGTHGRAAPDPAQVPVALHAVRYSVPGRDEPVLDGADLAIAPGEIVVVVGPNGTGKSTVVSLLLGFLSPSRGSVTVGDVDLRDLDRASWRSRVAHLPEHPALLAETLAENLRLADPGATDEELLAALADVGAPEFVRSLPAGLATRLGDGGRPVSSGELQRIALARTLLRRSTFYVLDEPTVHLDGATEAAVVRALRRVLAGRSALVVTHRPAVAQLADRVVTLRAGRFVPTDVLPFTPEGRGGPVPAGFDPGAGAGR